MKLRMLTASLALAAGLGIAPASQALDLGNLAGGLVNLAKAATLSDDDAKELAFDAAQHMDSQNKIAPPNSPGQSHECQYSKNPA